MHPANIYQPLALSLLLLIGCASAAQLHSDKAPSHFDFLGLGYFSSQDELNQTFEGVAQQVKTLLPVGWRVNSSLTYSLSNIRTTFRYRPYQQKAAVLDNMTIAVQGEGLYVELSFDWSKTGSSRALGKGVAGGMSD